MVLSNEGETCDMCIKYLISKPESPNNSNSMFISSLVFQSSQFPSCLWCIWKGDIEKLRKEKVTASSHWCKKESKSPVTTNSNNKACPSFPDCTSYDMLAAKRNQNKNQFKQSKQFKALTVFPDNCPEGHPSSLHAGTHSCTAFLPGYHANKQQSLWQPHYNASDASAPEEVSEPVNNSKYSFWLTNFSCFWSRVLQLVNLGKTKKTLPPNPQANTFTNAAQPKICCSREDSVLQGWDWQARGS